MWSLPLVAGALAMMAPRPDAELGASGQVRGGVTPTMPGSPPMRELRFTVEPYAEGSLRTRRWSSNLRYSLRPNWRIPAPAGNARPLLYHEATSLTSLQWTRRLAQTLTLNAGVGELDYFGLVGAFTEGQQTLPAAQTQRRVTFGATVGSDVRLSPRHQIEVRTRGEYDGSAPPSAWHEPPDENTRLFPLRYTVDAQINDRLAVSRRTTLVSSATAVYSQLSTQQAFVSASAMVSGEHRFTADLTGTLGGGVVYARRTSCLRPGENGSPLAPVVLGSLSRRMVNRRGRLFTLGVDGSYTSMVDYVQASIVRMTSLGIRGGFSDGQKWRSALSLYASSRNIVGDVPATDLFLAESEAIGADLNVTYTASDRWRYSAGVRGDLRANLRDGAGLDASRLGAWAYVQVDARLWTTRPTRRPR
ncbi:MAG: hypothetical protein B7733_04905 [Myxococcales bacterium FL481]|nr:MAG: hypothetical protein B7733_04905 [Myxococcales bacterium FL481]